MVGGQNTGTMGTLKIPKRAIAAIVNGWLFPQPYGNPMKSHRFWPIPESQHDGLSDSVLLVQVSATDTLHSKDQAGEAMMLGQKQEQTQQETVRVSKHHDQPRTNDMGHTNRQKKGTSHQSSTLKKWWLSLHVTMLRHGYQATGNIGTFQSESPSNSDKIPTFL